MEFLDTTLVESELWLPKKVCCKHLSALLYKHTTKPGPRPLIYKGQNLSWYFLLQRILWEVLASCEEISVQADCWSFGWKNVIPVAHWSWSVRTKSFRSVLSRIRQFTMLLKAWLVIIRTLLLTLSKRRISVCVSRPDPCASVPLIWNVCFPCWPADTVSLAFGLEKAWMMVQKISESSYQLLTQANMNLKSWQVFFTIQYTSGSVLSCLLNWSAS